MYYPRPNPYWGEEDRRRSIAQRKHDAEAAERHETRARTRQERPEATPDRSVHATR
jgi:hypothetical protein